MMKQDLEGIYRRPILAISNTVLFAAILVAPLRSYCIATIAGFNLSVYRIAWLLVITVAILEFLAKADRVTVSRRITVISFIVLTIVSSLAISFVISSNIYVSDTITRFLVRFFGWLFIILFFSLVFSNYYSIQTSIKAFILSPCIPLIIGGYQLLWFLIKGSFPSLPFAKFSVIETPEIVYWKYPRIMSTFIEPNYFGLFLAVTALIVISFLIFESSKMQPLLPKLLLWLIFFFCVIELFFTLSLSSMLGFVGGMLVILFFSSKYRIRNLIQFILFTTMLVFSVHILFIRYFSFNLVQMMYDRFSIRMESASTLFDRETYYKAAIRLFMINPIIGGGMGQLIDYTSASISSAHSAFLTVLGEQGLLGFLPLAGFFIYVVVILYAKMMFFVRVGDVQEFTIGVGLLAATIAVILSNFFYDSMFSFDSSWVVLGIVAAYVTSPTRRV